MHSNKRVAHQGRHVTSQFQLKFENGIVNLKPILMSHGWINLAPAEIVNNGFRYALFAEGDIPTTVIVTQERRTIMIQSDRKTSQCQNTRLATILKHMLSLDFPLDEFQAECKARKEQKLLNLAMKGWGRMFRSANYWEDAAKTLCTTNASWSYTQQMCRRLCDYLGETTHSGFKTFPLPAKVIDAGEGFLKDTVGMGYRSKSLYLLAERTFSGHVPWLLDLSISLNETEVEKEIISWHGFGKYATRHLLVLMGFHDHLPVDREVGLHLGVRKSGDRSSRLDADHFEDWGRFRFTAYKLNRVVRHLNWIGD